MSSAQDNKKPSLTNLVILIVSLAMVFLLLGNLVLNVINTRGLLQGQLYSHSQDSATSLGLSLSTVVDARDDVLAGRMIDAIFDSGDYARIIYFGTDGAVRVSRRLPPDDGAAPNWFVRLLDFDAPIATAQVMSGWKQLGKLVVQSSAADAYQKLWRTAQNQLAWFALVLLLALLAMKVLLNRLLEPLKQVESQAHEMARRNFEFRLAAPPTRELAQVSVAMNEMAESLGKVFQQQLDAIEQLREQSLLDSLTGLYNREGFDRRLKAELESPHGVRQGTLMLLKVNDFDGVNQLLGRSQADEVLCSIAKILGGFLDASSMSFVSRRAGADFSIFIPDLAGGSVEVEAEKLMSQLNSMPWARQSLRDDMIHMGVVSVGAMDDAARLLSKADLALRNAQSAGVSGWQRYADIVGAGVPDEVKTANAWHQSLQQALASEDILVYFQDVFGISTEKPIYRQALARLPAGDEVIDASVFLPMARRFGLMQVLDQFVISKTLDFMVQQSWCASVSVSELTLADPGFIAWLEKTLSGHPDEAARLYVQVPEYALKHGEVHIDQLSGMLSRFGARLVVERFGISSVPFSYLQRLQISAIKIDHSFIRDIHENIENQFFLRSVTQLASSQGVSVIAVGVESAEERETLKSLGVDGAMGYFLGRPRAAGDVQ